MVAAKKCPECNSSKLIYDETRGEVICGACGLLVEEKMVDTSHELRSFDKSEKKSRGGAPISLQKFDKGLTTNVGEISEFTNLTQLKQRENISD